MRSTTPNIDSFLGSRETTSRHIVEGLIPTPQWAEWTATGGSATTSLPNRQRLPGSGGSLGWSLVTTLWNYRDIIMQAGSSMYEWYNSDSPTSAPSPAPASTHHPASATAPHPAPSPAPASMHHPASATSPAPHPAPTSAPSPEQNAASSPYNSVHVIGQAITSLSAVEDTAPAIEMLSRGISKLCRSQTIEASALISDAISVLSPNPNVPRPVIASLATVIATLADPRGLLSDNLPSLGVTYQFKQISLVLTSMLSTAEILNVKVMSPVKVALETKDCITLDGIATALFSAKTLILPVELSSMQGSHWVFLVIDAQLGMVKLLDTENAHEAVVRDFLSHSSLSTWQFSTINIDHQQYSDSCGVEGVGQLIAYLKNTTAIDPASAAVVQSMTHLDYLIGALGSIFNADHFYRVKDFVIEQVNKAINFALDSNNQALVVDLFNQADSVQGMCPLQLGAHPFKPDHEDPDYNFEGNGRPQNWPLQDKNPIGLIVGINGTIYGKEEGGYE